MPVVKCPDCGTFNSTHDEACKKCGASFKPNLARVDGPKSSTGKRPWYKKLLRREK